MLAWSSIAQAGYILAGVVVATELGAQATIFYLAVYLVMNVTAFAVIIARERETEFGDDLESVAGLGASRPVLAWPLTIAALGLAGIPATAGFIGKFFLIDAAGGWRLHVARRRDRDRLDDLARVLPQDRVDVGDGPASRDRPADGRAVLRARAGGRGRAWVGARRRRREARMRDEPKKGTDAAPPHYELYAIAVIGAVATIFFGIVVSPLMDVALDAAQALGLG